MTLVEQYAPGTVRSARAATRGCCAFAHGEVDWYTELARRARSMWIELQEETGTRIWEPVGVAWFAQREDGFEARSRAALDRLGVPYEWLAPDDARELYPSLATDDLAAVLYEPEAGVLHARRATQLLVEDGERPGVLYESAASSPRTTRARDVVIWACGPWLRIALPRARRAEDDAPRRLLLRRRRVVARNARILRVRRAVLRPRRDRRARGQGRARPPRRRDRPRHARPAAAAGSRAATPATMPRGASRRSPARRWSARASASTTSPSTRTSSSTAIPSAPRWWLIGGSSGHGFKHGPALGRVRRRLHRGDARARAVPRARPAHRATPACAPRSFG